MLKKIANFTIVILLFQIFAFNANSQIVPDEDVLTKPVLSFKGISNFSLAGRKQSSAFEKTQLPNSFSNNRYKDSYGANNNSQFFINADATSKSDLEYGVRLKLETEISSDQDRGRIDVDQAFIFAESEYGKLEFGNVIAVNQKMKVGPASFAKGNGGINGNYLKYVNLPTLNNSSNSNVKLPNFILVAQSPIGHGGYAQSFYNDDFNKNRLRTIRDKSFNGAEDAVKLNYYTPRIEGFQVGASYTQDTSQDGLATTIVGNNSTIVKNVLSLGANYSGNFNNVGYAISATAENGTVNKSQSYGTSRNNLSSYDIATTIAYFGFTVGASYGSWGSSLQPKSGQGIYSCDYNSGLALSLQNCSSNSKNFNSASYYTLGAAYEFGPIGASITSLKSDFQKNKYQAISLDIDYKLRKGFIPYFEITQFEFKSNQVQASDISTNQIQDNKGFVALVGFLLSF
jgi:hypothetical protein